MTTNLLTPDQADFEGSITGWTAVQDATPPVSLLPLNMLSQEQATFEANTSTAGSSIFQCNWASNGASLITWDWSTDNPAEGNRCLHVIPNFAGGSWPAIWPAFPNNAAWFAPCTAGKTYTFLASIRLPQTVAVQGWSLNIAWYDAAGTAVGTVASANLPAAASDWRESRLVAVAPAGAVKMRPQIYSTFRTTDGTYYLDKCGLYEGDVEQWFAPNQGWAPNLLDIEQADFETNTATTGGQVSGWLRYSAGNTITNSTEQAVRGTHSLKLGPNASGGLGAEPRVMAPPAGADARWYHPITGGAGCTVIVSYRPSSAGDLCAPWIVFENDAGTNVGNSAPVGQTVVGGWIEAVSQAVAPATATRWWTRISNAASPVVPQGEGAYIDRVALYNGFVGAWFDPRTVTAAQASGGSHGTKSMALTRLGPTGTIEARTTTVNAATYNKSYTGMATFKVTIAHVARVYLDFLDAGGNVLSTAIGTVNALPGEWSKARVVAVAPSGVATVRLRTTVMMVNQGEVVLVDQAGLMDGETTEWAAGGATVPPSIIVLPDPNRHRMAISIRDLTSSAPISLVRLLPGGRSEPVRHAQALVPTGNIALTDDYDVPTDTLFRYQATQSGKVIATSEFVALDSGNTFWLGEVNTGQFVQIIPAANAIPQWTRQAPVGVHRVLGRQDPVVVSDVRWWAEGELTHYTLSMNQRDLVGNIWSFGVTLGFYGPVDIIGGIGRLYIISNSVDERRVSARGYEDAREWHAQITQVAEPTGDARIPVVVTWQDVVDGYATWQDVVDGEQDWLDVMQGVPGNEDVLPPVGWDW